MATFAVRKVDQCCVQKKPS